MDALFIAIDYRYALWLTMAFVAGFAFQLIGPPPLIGFLVTGFTLNFLGTEPTLFLS
jgi:glutathione-regulated potassium-efflux system ancillary protein KefC